MKIISNIKHKTLITKFIQCGLRLWARCQDGVGCFIQCWEWWRCTWTMFSVIQWYVPSTWLAKSLHETFRYRNYHSQHTSYQHDINLHMVIMSIRHHGIKGISTKTPMVTMSILPSWQQRDLNQNIHNNPWWIHLPWNRHKDSASYIKQESKQHNISHRKWLKKYMTTILHIPQLWCWLKMEYSATGFECTIEIVVSNGIESTVDTLKYDIVIPIWKMVEK